MRERKMKINSQANDFLFFLIKLNVKIINLKIFKHYFKQNIHLICLQKKTYIKLAFVFILNIMIFSKL